MINSYGLRNCSADDVVIPGSVRYIFFNGVGKSGIYYAGTIEDYFRINFKEDMNASDGAKGGTAFSISYILDQEKGSIELGGKKFSEFDYEEIVIPDSITRINSWAFFTFTPDVLVIGQNVEKIGYRAFTGYTIDEVYNLSKYYTYHSRSEYEEKGIIYIDGSYLECGELYTSLDNKTN